MNYRTIPLILCAFLMSGYTPTVQAMDEWHTKKLLATQERLDKELFQACKSGSIKNVRDLVAQGACINAINEDSTPLHAASYNGYLNIVEFLIKRGAGIEAEDINQYTALHFACQEGHYAVAKKLIETKANLDAYTKYRKTPLHIACIRGHYQIVKLLVDKNAYIDAMAENFETPLYFVFMYKHPSIAPVLIDSGASLNISDRGKRTPLHLACCFKENVQAIKYMLKHGANLNAVDIHATTPLHVACYKGHCEIVAALIKTPGIKINAQNDALHTPLYATVLGNHPKVVALLLATGADINLRSSQDLSPLDLAYDQNQSDIIQLFCQYGSSIISDEQADANMRAFFAELDKETEVKESTRGKNWAKNQKKKLRAKEKKKNLQNITTPSPLTQEPQIEEISETTTSMPLQDEVIPMVTAEDQQPDQTTITPHQPVKIVADKKITQAPAHIHQPAHTHNKYVVGHHEKFKWPKSLNSSQRTLLLDRLKQLKNWPEIAGLDITPLKGNKGLFRLRVGEHRVIFSVNEANRQIMIHEIALRKSVYKNVTNY